MGLTRVIFSEDREDDIAGFDVGHYSDFGCFRGTIARHVDVDDFPILMTHSDCDGDWEVEQLPGLIREIEVISERFKTLPPEEPQEAFEHTAQYRVGAASLFECFHNVDGENLFEAIVRLAKMGIELGRPISFQ